MTAALAKDDGAFPALVLNADYRPKSVYPLETMPWTEAVKNALAGQVIVVAEYDRIIRSPSFEMRLPSVVALRHYVKPKNNNVAVTRNNVFLRDNYTCQYCPTVGMPRDLTFDHVIPRSKGGKTTFENVVTACSPCNNKKGDRLLRQTDMQLRCTPVRPTLEEIQSKAMRFANVQRRVHRTWADFLYWQTDLDE